MGGRNAANGRKAQTHDASLMVAPIRIVARPLYSTGTILCFHSVTTAKTPAAEVSHVSLQQLADFLNGVRQVAEVVPLTDLIERHQSGRSTAGLVAITFDDAYSSVVEAAATVFAPDATPMTIFTVADAVETGQRFWWDRVADACDRATPECWSTFAAACGLPATHGRDATINRFETIRDVILAKHAGRWPSRLESALDRLEVDSGVRTPHRSMTMAELSSLSASPWVQIGVHTRSHPVLPLLSDEEGELEIRDCHRFLRERFASTVPVLAAPFGLFDRRTIDVSRRAGMRACLTLSGQTIRPSDEHAFPRFCIDRRTSVWRFLLRTTTLAERLRRRTLDAAFYPKLPTVA